MFALTHRVIKTRNGKVYSGEPTDFEDHGATVIYKGVFCIFKHHIHAENITEDYESFVFSWWPALLLLTGITVSILAFDVPEDIKLVDILQAIEITDSPDSTIS